MGNVTLTLEPISAEEMRGRHPVELTRWDYDANHYRATLTYQGRSATFRFATGSGWDRKPDVRDVLQSVLDEAASVSDANTVDEAAEILRDEYGEDFNLSRATVRALLDNSRKVQRLLGDEWEDVLEDVNAWTWAHTPDPIERPMQKGAPFYSGRVGMHRDGYPVRVMIELRDTGKGPELSIMGETPNGGGQCIDELDGIVSYCEPWNAEKVSDLARIWRTWHLNGMNSACEHQRALGWKYDDHLDQDDDPETNPGYPYAGERCPECGYRIGSAWLYEPLPADVLAWLAEIGVTLNGKGK